MSSASNWFGNRASKSALLFFVLFAFYLGLAGSVSTYGLLTGGFSAFVVSVTFAHATFDEPPRLATTPVRLLRSLVYLPYLLWEVVKANLAIAYLVLHPALPIDPSIEQYDPTVGDPVPLTMLAVSVTLTPGTLIVDVRDSTFHVHSLTPASWNDLLEGRLERAVKFVFDGQFGGAPRRRGTSRPETGREDDSP